MKKTFLATAFLLLVGSLLKAQSNTQPINFKKDFTSIKSNVWVSKYEVTNASYHLFLEELQSSEQQKKYQQCLPDTNCWIALAAYQEPIKTYYFRHPAYSNYPVVGVCYDAAKLYCNWLTQQYNQNPKRKFEQVEFRLLTKAEWIFAANKGDTTRTYPWGSGYIQNNRKADLCNYRHIDLRYDSIAKKYIELPDTFQKRITLTAAVNAYFPNSFGLYNMSGNVAEMVQDAGIAMGGGFNDPPYLVQIKSEKKYNAPSFDIGFRVAMEVVKE
jgi:formylglycine-generating enzyme required for sulfatase activity